MNQILSRIAVMTVLVTAVTTAQGALFSFNSAPGSTAIPDYPGSGVAYHFAINDASFTSIQDVSVTVNITGGWNGDLYGYLTHASGFAVLFNQVGAGSSDADGYGTAGFNNITLSSLGTTDIHAVATPASGTYAADGRLVYTDATPNPLHTLNVFNGANPNGDWTLYFADVAALNSSTLVDWRVDINAVPEPTTWGLIGFGVVFAGTGAVRWWRSRLAAARSEA